MAKENENRVGGQVRAGAIVQAHTVERLYLPPERPPVVPWQLPPDLVHFADRTGEQEQVLAAATEVPTAGGPLVVALSGMGGIGKTALGFQLARVLRDRGRCPDGILHLDLDDLRRDGAVELADALGRLTRDLDPDAVLPPGYADRRRRYWSASQDKRLVLVLDNARSGAEVLPLLPSSAAGIVIVTSHGRLHDLDGTRAVELPLGPLDGEDATGLLRATVSDPRLSADPEAAAELARRCAGLPAALQVAGRWVRKHRSRELGRLIEELTVELHRDGVPVVEAVWDAAYASLSPGAARLYRLLPHHPGPVVTVGAAAALLDSGAEPAEEALEELEEAGLLHPRPDGLGLHDLIRGHARRRAAGLAEGDEAEDAAAARRRLVGWYRRQAARADLVAAGPRLVVSRTPGEEPDVAFDVSFASPHEAMHWLEREHLALYGCVRIAYEDGLDADAVALCEPLWTHFLDHQHYADVIDAFGLGVAAADRAEDPLAAVRMRCQLARPLWEQRRYEEAAENLHIAVERAGLLGSTVLERKLRASAAEFRGKLASVQNDWAAAIPDFEAARAEHLAIDNRYGAMLQTYLLGRAALALGDPDRAVTLLTEAHEVATELRRDRMISRTAFELGTALWTAGRPAEAEPHYRAALAGARARQSSTDQLRVLDRLAAFHEELGEAEEAAGYRAEAARLRG
ncbi:tetratricopeptide repeat protein [Kitasatospora sp. SUK 42]|uniref:tetratricopeptide repeat protein n=1 Tax=Kitasatospora sp. SUK 42 TaxID=1588882 RepID=UPI0018C961A7|nr:tetratricopeptide repeat protein [Kitasatospora sp. SUK 42]MBV2156522.1 tetratricopeptide repeat protein [Kitasatospora sp. SUK 42]